MACFPSRRFSVALVAWLSTAFATVATAAALPSAAIFRSPPAEVGVHTWWHWMDGNISREGITKDLEVMHAQGVTQATILNIGLFDGRSFGVPSVKFGSPEWFAMYRWALDEAARLGLRLGVHNCDGWSSSGGPWISPEQSMMQYTWTTSLAAGGRTIEQTLPAPNAVAGFYRDAAVVAYRTDRSASTFRSAAPQLEVNGAAREAAMLTDGNPVSGFAITTDDRLVFTSPQPIAFSRVAVHLRRSFMWADPAAFVTRLAVEVSMDGGAYQPAAEFSVQGVNQTAIVELPETSARFVRVTVREKSNLDPWIPLELTEFEPLGAAETPAFHPSIPFLGEKTGAAKGSMAAVYTMGSDARVIAPRDVVVLTDRMDVQGRLRWEAPPGSWAIVRFGYTSTGATNAPATAEGVGLECDKLDARAVDHHFRAFSEKLIDEAGAHAGQALKFILVDSWEAGFQNWTERFPEEFERRRGYSLLPWLPVLVGETVSSAHESEAVLFDVRQTIADLIRENYYDRFAELLHARNVELHAEVIYGGTGYPPLDVLRATENVDLPMMEFWTHANRQQVLGYEPAEATTLELPVSAALVYGKPLVGSEAYTGMAHFSEAPAELKPYGDRAFATGVNRMILHSSVHQPTEDQPGMTLHQFGSHFNRNNLYWRRSASWIAYQARIQALLGQGSESIDVLYFLGDQLPQEYVRHASTTLPPGYRLAAVNADALTDRVRVVNGRIQLNETGDIALLSLPPYPAMSLATLQRLAQLIESGAHVYGPKPQRPLSLADQRELPAFQALADRVWGEVDGQRARSRAFGRGSINWGAPIGDVLRRLQVPPRFAASPGAKAEFLHTARRVGDAEVFFVANQLEQVLDRECTFRVGRKAPEIWDPETGTIVRPAVLRVDGDRVSLPVRFQPRQALLFVFRDELPPRFVTSARRDGVALFPAGAQDAGVAVPQLRFDGDRVLAEAAKPGAFTFATNDGQTLTATLAAPEQVAVEQFEGTVELVGPGVPPEQAKFPVRELRSLTEHEWPAVRYFSGEAIYRLRFRVPQAGGGATDTLWLDLGGFSAIAEVSLNGHALGQRWRPGTPLEVTRHLRAENELVVKVVNVYRNRFIGDFAEHGTVKNLSTSAPIQDFLAADYPLKPSGLFGPITIRRIPLQPVNGF